MKFIAAALALAAVASAQIQLSDPTEGTVWKVGVPQYVRWTGNCAAMGAAGKAVSVEVVNGPAGNVKFVATIGNIDCSSTNTSTMLTVPPKTNNGDFETGTYALRVNTVPNPQFSTNFRIENPSAPSPSAPAATTGAPQPTTKPSAANTLMAGSALAMAALAVVQLVL